MDIHDHGIPDFINPNVSAGKVRLSIKGVISFSKFQSYLSDDLTSAARMLQILFGKNNQTIYNAFVLLIVRYRNYYIQYEDKISYTTFYSTVISFKTSFEGDSYFYHKRSKFPCV